jgi:hypothetical protein
VKKGIAVLGMKSMGDGLLLKSGAVTPVECLRYALSLPTTTVITGCESMDILNQALHVARTFQPMSDAEQEALLAKTRTPALSGRFELFKQQRCLTGRQLTRNGWVDYSRIDRSCSRMRQH